MNYQTNLIHKKCKGRISKTGLGYYCFKCNSRVDIDDPKIVSVTKNVYPNTYIFKLKTIN